MILIELKGTHVEDAFEQLLYMQTQRSEYKEIEALFMAGQNGRLHREAFIVSNFKRNEVEKQRLENRYGIRVKAILHSEATSPVPDVRAYLK